MKRLQKFKRVKLAKTRKSPRKARKPNYKKVIRIKIFKSLRYFALNVISLGGNERDLHKIIRRIGQNQIRLRHMKWYLPNQIERNTTTTIG